MHTPQRGKRLATLYLTAAVHAFGNETGANHNAEATKLAWQRTTDFFAKNLR